MKSKIAVLAAIALGAILSSSPVKAEPNPANTEVFFDTDKADMRASEVQKLHDLSAFIVHHDALVTLVGNADKRAGRLYNLDLGLRRAESVKAKLIEFGVDAESIVVATSYGEEKPKAPSDNLPAHLQANRRTDAIVLQVRTKTVIKEVPVEVEKLVVRRHRITVLGGYAPSGVNKAKLVAPNTFEVTEDFDPELGASYTFLTPLLNNRLSITAAGFSNKSGFLGIGVDF